MRYCDLHCDALTASGGVVQVTKETLEKGGCFLQCFAAFVSAREGRFASALSLCGKFGDMCRENGFHAVTSAKELKEDKLNALLTVEEGGAAEGSLEKLRALYECGVRMMTLIWNHPNEIGYPNFPDYEGLKTGRAPFSLRETARGLTPFGIELVAYMNEIGMMIDVSHGSDKLFFDVAAACKRAQKPFVASHSGSNAVYNCARNLTDEQIKTLGDCGGVVGLDFCADFLSDDKSAEGQRDALLAHARAIVDAGGADVLAIGSDFDGIPENPYLKNPSYMPEFLDALSKKFGSAATEKFARKNFLRVFGAVCG